MRIQSSIVRFHKNPDPVRLGEVIPREFSKVFEPIGYRPYLPEVFQARGHFVVTRSAAVYPSWRLTRQTLYSNILAQARAHAISLASVAKRGFAPLPDPERQYGIIHSPWTAGYYHWLSESLPRALVMRQTYPNAVPLLPSERYRPYLNSLHATGQREAQFFPEGRNAQVLDPIVSNCPAEFATTSPSLMQELQRTILSELGIQSAPPHRKIYISRAQSRGRFVLNERELADDLERQGFEIVYAEKLTFRQQVALLNSAKILLSIHGAGLTNLIFMQPGTSVIEMLPYRNGLVDYHKSRNSFRHDACYVRLAAAMNLNYAFLQCDHDAPLYRGTHMSNLLVDRSAISRLLQAF